jgi:hypothetical protein
MKGEIKRARATKIKTAEMGLWKKIQGLPREIMRERRR